MEYRVEQLAAACDVSVDTVRYYQSKGLLPPPERSGRVAHYGPEHLDRIREIRALQRRGLTLALIKRMVEGSLDRGDQGLAAAVARAHSDDEDEEFLSLEEVAERSGVPTALLRAVERAGLSIGRKIDGEERYTLTDVEMVRRGLRLLDSGFPLDELLGLAVRFS